MIKIGVVFLFYLFQLHNGSGCNFPEHWTGSWFLSGHRERLHITLENLGTIGTCHQHKGENKYILANERENCLQCLAIWERHENVLEFKAGDCRVNILARENICDISPDLPLHTLARLEGSDVPCPIQAPLSFTYKRSEGRECLSPLSTITKCIKDTQLLLRFQACPDLANTESKEEILTCKAVWTDDRDVGQTFLLATLDYRYRRTEEERVRCFLMRNTTSGHIISQSSDATCHAGLQSPTAGYVAFNMKTVSFNSNCTFPPWLSSGARFLSFDYKSLFVFSPDGKEMMKSNYSYTTREENLVSRTSCVQTMLQMENSVKLITRSVMNCESVYNCVIITRKTDNIVQLEEGLPTLVRMAACAASNFKPRSSLHETSTIRSPFYQNRIPSYEPQTAKLVTLIRESIQIQPCPKLGEHNLTGLFLAGDTQPCNQFGFTRVAFSCPRIEQIEFYRDCPSDPDTSSYFCLGSWKEEISLESNFGPSLHYSRYSSRRGRIENITYGYIIAKPEIRNSNSHRRICFVYTNINSTYSWTVGKTECLKLIQPGHQGSHRFNSTRLGSCPDSGSSTTKLIPVIIYLVLVKFLQSCHLSGR
ncbi:uncharacterized protein LOC111705149 isoform X2 [Eurytemora carolleeae]|uniref:uncharacterized protein LOC111705149 isoform X2 n=1 Tax=Eurytemora carolleeae TaxID=1294199 RepID=UPI000C769781|nr:uncharacterized protein LOC111705149 isoform X2 [Eurytemora carolleeae]|eukprot:XP_023333381.1 uncharacterized protein LOC111705149 isoform X2 [Eurytemora affinis]